MRVPRLQDGNTAAWWAAGCGLLEALRTLLAAGANPAAADIVREKDGKCLSVPWQTVCSWRGWGGHWIVAYENFFSRLCDKRNPSSIWIGTGRGPPCFQPGGPPTHSPDCLSRGHLLLPAPPPCFPTPCPPCISRSLFLPRAHPPPLQYDVTPLHAAASTGSDHVVVLLLATPGVNPLAKTRVRGVQRWLCGLPACPTLALLPCCCRPVRLRWTGRKRKEGLPQPRCCERTRASQRRSQKQARREPKLRYRSGRSWGYTA